MTAPLATYVFIPGNVDAAVTFLKRTRNELRTLRFVRLWKDKLQIFDINRDYFEIQGIGYPDADIVPLLQQVNTAYNPQTVHEATTEEYKEMKTGRRYCWAADRVM